MNAIVNINTIEDLIAFRDSVNSGTSYEGLTVTLTADIDMSKVDNWNAIGTILHQFKGTFDGGGYKISNLKIDKNKNLQGLFGVINGATIKNLGLENVNVKGTGTYYVGGLVGWNSDGTIKNCYGAGKVTGNNRVGGLVGYSLCGTIKNSYWEGQVKGIEGVGGLVGYNADGTIKNSYATGTVTGTYYVGGLVGDNTGIVTNSYYNKDNAGVPDNGFGTPLSSKEFQEKSAVWVNQNDKGEKNEYNQN